MHACMHAEAEAEAEGTAHAHGVDDSKLSRYLYFKLQRPRFCHTTLMERVGHDSAVLNGYCVSMIREGANVCGPFSGAERGPTLNLNPTVEKARIRRACNKSRNGQELLGWVLIPFDYIQRVSPPITLGKLEPCI